MTHDEKVQVIFEHTKDAVEKAGIKIKEGHGEVTLDLLREAAEVLVKDNPGIEIEALKTYCAYKIKEVVTGLQGDAGKFSREAIGNLMSSVMTGFIPVVNDFAKDVGMKIEKYIDATGDGFLENLTKPQVASMFSGSLASALAVIPLETKESVGVPIFVCLSLGVESAVSALLQQYATVRAQSDIEWRNELLAWAKGKVAEKMKENESNPLVAHSGEQTRMADALKEGAEEHQLNFDYATQAQLWELIEDAFASLDMHKKRGMLNENFQTGSLKHDNNAEDSTSASVPVPVHGVLVKGNGTVH